MPVTGECPDLLPHGWIVKKTSDKTHFYYYNYETGESTWTKPAPDIDVGAVAMAAAAAVGEKPSPKRSVEGDGSDRHNKRRKREQSSAPSKGASSTSAKDPTGKVRVMHILKKHNKSSRPSSWREEKITRSLDEAREELEGIRSMILEQESNPEELLEVFRSLAEEESDCSSAKRRGDLGFFEFKKMKRNFSEVAFKLEVNEVSELVETSSGVHLICRLA
mmetsp:Transcript_13622/g.27098  ORF Transcript_13622/g.27098 Transcript_13622/m.27098 type:complete len:220 (+) Transcript_13622:198-857(+)